MFASEAKALFQHPPPGHLLVHENGHTEIRRYWELVLGDYQPVNLDEAVEEFGALLAETVRAHLVSDVPLGVLLSGGLDSGAVTALTAAAISTPLKTFAVGFDLPAAHNELAEARATPTHRSPVTSSRPRRAMRNGVWGMRNAELQWELERPLDPPFQFRTPHSGERRRGRRGWSLPGW